MTTITHINTNIDIATTEALSMQGLYGVIQSAFPKDPNTTVIGISIPILGINCKETGIISPIDDFKEAVSRIFNDAMGAIFKPIWQVLVDLANVLGLGLLDEKLPILDLSIGDLFSRDLFDNLLTIVTRLYNTAKEQLQQILSILGIPTPFFTEIVSPEKEIYYIVKTILGSLWDTIIKKIKSYIDMILTALKIYDAINQTGFSITWEAAITAILERILSYLALPPSLQDVVDLIKLYVKQVLGYAEATYGQIMSIIENFTMPVFGKPFDWLLPLNPKTIAPNIDFIKLISDIKLWLTNFIAGLIQKFIDAVLSVLQFFGITFEWVKINVPIKLCVIQTIPAR
jgi:hypothetical protein